jgi:hypothetical protein
MSEWVPTRQHYDFVQQQINRVRHVRAEVIIKTALMYGGIWIAHALPGWMFWRWLFSDASMAWGVLFVVILATSMTVWWLMRLGIPGDDNLSVICAHCKESLYIPQSWFCGHCGGKNVVKRVGAFGIGAPVGPMLFDKCSFGSCGEKWQVGFECPKCAKHNVWSKRQLGARSRRLALRSNGSFVPILPKKLVLGPNGKNFWPHSACSNFWPRGCIDIG